MIPHCLAFVQSEMKAVHRLEHKNIVRLVAACTDQMKALIYEFMPNGDVEHLIWRCKHVLLQFSIFTPSVFGFIAGSEVVKFSCTLNDVPAFKLAHPSSLCRSTQGVHFPLDGSPSCGCWSCRGSRVHPQPRLHPQRFQGGQRSTG